VVRPTDDAAHALIRPRGTIYIDGLRNAADHPLGEALARGLRLSSSRCGSFAQALALLKNHPDIADLLAHRMITHRFDQHSMTEAFEVAADSSRSIKVLITYPSRV
jgi:threonine dehydrogenase-like Zn-dependent dehydrogenase